MQFFVLLTNAQDIYKIYKALDGFFVDKTKEIMLSISEKELSSAIKTLDDIKHSNNKNREFSSVITQLRLAIEKMDSDAINKWKTAILIALCYKVLNEKALSLKFGNHAIEYFDNYIETKRNWMLFPAKEYWRGVYLGTFVKELETIWINHKDKEPNRTFFESLWFGNNETERIENVVRESRKEFSITIEKLLSPHR